MRRPTTACLLLLLASCGAHISDNNAGLDPTDAAVSEDAGVPVDAASDAMGFGPWSPPVAVTVAMTAADEDDVTLSSNALEMIFAVAGTSTKNLFYTSRAAIGGAWKPIAPLPFNTASSDESPRFSGDDKTLYFASDQGSATAGDLNIFMVARTTVGTNNTWGAPKALGKTINTTAVEKWYTPCVSGGVEHYVVARNTAANGTDLFEGTVGGGDPQPLTGLNSVSNETSAFLTQDCLTLYFASNRSTLTKLYMTRRAAVAQPWGQPALITDFKLGGGTDNQEDPWISPDGHTFAFASDFSGSKDVYLSTR